MQAFDTCTRYVACGHSYREACGRVVAGKEVDFVDCKHESKAKRHIQCACCKESKETHR